MDLLKRLAAIRTALLLDQPFFGMLALRLTLAIDPTCKTAWTDGKSLGLNPTYVQTLTDDQLKGLIAHEVMHCACGHPWRRGARDHKRFNVACDHAINPLLTKAGMQLPEGALSDPGYDGKWAEWIYDRLPEDPKSDDQGNGDGDPDPNGASQDALSTSDKSNDPGSDGEVRDAPSDADAPTETEWQQDVKQALSQSRGTMSGGTKAEIAAASAARVDWRALLRKYVQEVAKADYTWTCPNVRYIPLGLFLPSLHSIACGPIVVAVDTSGSIDDVLLSQFAAEIKTIADELQPAYIDVIYCDTQVHRVDRFERGESVDIHAIGRGGTSFVPVFDHMRESGDTPAVLIYLTDLDGSFPDQGPDYPVVWASYGTSNVAPFGDTVPCE